MAIVLRGNGESTFSNDVGIDGTITDSLTVANGLNLTDGNLVVADGHGIDFSATGNSSGTMSGELFSDYEEGTWTPGIADRTVTGSAVGFYTRIGRVVTITFQVSGLNSQLDESDNPTITGLPFTTLTATAFAGAVQITDISSITYDTGFSNVYGRFTQNVNTVALMVQRTDGSSHATGPTLLTPVVLRGAGFYLVDS